MAKRNATDAVEKKKEKGMEKDKEKQGLISMAHTPPSPSCAMAPKTPPSPGDEIGPVTPPSPGDEIGPVTPPSP
jgi:hypothetical protein